MPTTSENIADSIATQYAGAMDNMVADAARMEAERDEARAQLATLHDEKDWLAGRILALALRLRNRTAFITTLGGHELQGNVIGPVALMTTDYQDPQEGDVTVAEVHELLALPAAISARAGQEGDVTLAQVNQFLAMTTARTGQ